MRFDNHLKTTLVLTLLVGAILLAGCGGGGGRSSAPKRLTLDEKIQSTEQDIQIGREHIDEMEKDLKEKEANIWTPGIMTINPKSVSEKTEEVEALKKKISKTKSKLTRDRGRLEDLKKAKQGSESSGGGC
jgi:hypothetical protein